MPGHTISEICNRKDKHFKSSNGEKQALANIYKLKLQN